MSDTSGAAAMSITVTPNGPYVLAGEVPVARRRVVASEHGEPMTWQTTERLAGRRALCRCGGSGSKPFCDGSHGRDGFQAPGPASGPSAGSVYEDRQTTYPAFGMVMRDDRTVCAHAGFCGNRLSNAWRMVNDTVDTIVRAQLIAMIERCPSGALTFRLDQDGQDVEPDLAPEVGVIEDGPLFVTGGIAVHDTDGTVLEVRNRMVLCRCGGSANKPYCDGAHVSTGFHDPS